MRRGPCSTAANETAREPYYAYGMGSLWLNESEGNSTYNALQLSVERRFAAGLTFNSYYTWGKSLDVESQGPNNNSCCTAFFNQVSDPYNVNAYRSVSDFNVAQSFNTALVWQLPSFAQRDNYFLKHVASHWMVSGIWQWQSGQPFSVFSGMDNSLSGVGLDYADRVPGVSPSLNTGRPHGQLVQEYFNTAAFQQNALGTFGNSGRNSLVGPRLNNLDLAIMRLFPIKSEKYHVMLRAESFNVTNTTHFGGMQSNISGPNFGQLMAAFDPRQLQFAAKFIW